MTSTVFTDIDWNKDGTIDDLSDGFGLLQNGDPGYTDQGYISQVKSHAKFAAQAPDATENIKIRSAICSGAAENDTSRWRTWIRVNGGKTEDAATLPEDSFGLGSLSGSMVIST